MEKQAIPVSASFLIDFTGRRFSHWAPAFNPLRSRLLLSIQECLQEQGHHYSRGYLGKANLSIAGTPSHQSTWVHSASTGSNCACTSPVRGPVLCRPVTAEFVNTAVPSGDAAVLRGAQEQGARLQAVPHSRHLQSGCRGDGHHPCRRWLRGLLHSV